MKIKMLASFAGAWNCNVGDFVDRPDAEAKRLIAAGFATIVETTKVEKPAETTTDATTAETTTAASTTEKR